MIFETDIISLSWHGFFSVIGVAVAVYMVIKQSRKDGIEDDLIFNVASWGVIGGIIGARLVHILDNLDYYIDNPINFLYIWRGGIDGSNWISLNDYFQIKGIHFLHRFNFSNFRF